MHVHFQAPSVDSSSDSAIVSPATATTTTTTAAIRQASRKPTPSVQKVGKQQDRNIPAPPRDCRHGAAAVMRGLCARNYN